MNKEINKINKNKKEENDVININNRYHSLRDDTAGDISQFFDNISRLDMHNNDIKLNSDNIFYNDEQYQIWDKNKNLTYDDVCNTFYYLFYKFKKGVFIRIINNKLETFIPFNNISYINEFSHLIKCDPKFKSFENFFKYINSLSGYNQENLNYEVINKWYSNNSLLKYHKDNESKGRSFNNDIIKNMFETLCKERKVPDIDLFINRRDFPQITKGGYEPYFHIWGDEHNLVSHNYKKYIPIISFSTSSYFADIPIPTYEDWELVKYQEEGNNISSKKYPKIEKIKWKNKINKAIFLGTTTGSGVTSNNNKRLKLFELSQKSDLLDVRITKWNLRPRKIKGEKYIKTIERKNYPTSDSMSLQEQSKYKYIIIVEGHVAAYRISYQLSSYSLILLIESEWTTWLSKYLKPYEHYIPIKDDLSDLITNINWCINNDKKCKKIAKNALKFFDKYINKKSILDFIQKRLIDINSQAGIYKYNKSVTDLFNKFEKNKIKEIMLKYNNKLVYNHKLSDRLFTKNIGVLDGISMAMQSENSIPKFIKILFKTKTSTVSLYTFKDINIVIKKSHNSIKKKENIRENFIGLNGINYMAARIPTFPYIFIPKDYNMVYMEYISSVNMFQWINSPKYNFKDLLDILIHINLSLIMSQNMIGFIHHDLHPWNIMLTTEKKEYNNHRYFIDTKTLIIFKSRLIPVILDFGKSRIVNYDKNYGLIDHFMFEGRSNLIDTITNLYSIINILINTNKFNSNEKRLFKFLEKLNIQNYKDVKHYHKFGIFNNYDYIFKDKDNKNITPKSFIDFIILEFTEFNFNIIKTNKCIYPMLYGPNPIVVENYLFTKDINKSISNLFENIDRNRRPVDNNKIGYEISSNILNIRIQWIQWLYDNDKMNLENKNLWNKIKKQIFSKEILTNDIELDYNFPDNNYILLKQEMSIDFLEEFFNKNTIISNDWRTIYSTCLEYNFYNENNNYFKDFIKIDYMKFFNVISNNNTLLLLYNMVKN